MSGLKSVAPYSYCYYHVLLPVWICWVSVSVMLFLGSKVVFGVVESTNSSNCVVWVWVWLGLGTCVKGYWLGYWMSGYWNPWLGYPMESLEGAVESGPCQGSGLVPLDLIRQYRTSGISFFKTLLWYPRAREGVSATGRPLPSSCLA